MRSDRLSNSPSRLASQLVRIEQIPLPVLLVDPETLLIIAANTACAEAVIIPGKRFLGRSLLQWVPESEREDLKAALRASLRRTGVPQSVQSVKETIEVRWEYSGFCELGREETQRQGFMASLLLQEGEPPLFQLTGLPRARQTVKKLA